VPKKEARDGVWYITATDAHLVFQALSGCFCLFNIVTVFIMET